MRRALSRNRRSGCWPAACRTARPSAGKSVGSRAGIAVARRMGNEGQESKVNGQQREAKPNETFTRNLKILHRGTRGNGAAALVMLGLSKPISRSGGCIRKRLESRDPENHP